MTFGTGDCTIEGEFTLPSKAAAEGYFDIFTLGTYSNLYSITLFKWGTAECGIRVYGPSGQTVDITLPAGVIPFGVRFKFALERYNGDWYIFINDLFYTHSEKIAVNAIFDFPTKKVRFGSDAMARTNQHIHNFRIIGGTALRAPGTIIYGIQQSTTTGAAKHAFDYDSEANYWYTGSNDLSSAWIGIDYKKVVTLSRLEARNGGSVITAYNVEYSNDGINWSVAIAKTGQNFYNGSIIRFDFPVSRGRYWRFRIIASDNIATSGLYWIKFMQSPDYLPTHDALAIYGAQYSTTTGAAKNAFDGIPWNLANSSQTWFTYSSTQSDAWAGLHYATAKEVNQATIDFSGSWAVTGYVIEYALDDGVWLNAATVTGINIVTGRHTVNFPAQVAKRWRYRMTGSTDWRNKEVAEIVFSKV